MAGKANLPVPVPEVVNQVTPNNPPTQDQVERKSFFDAASKQAKVTIDLNKLKIKKTLTKQLFSIAHSKNLVIKCLSEIYEQMMPMAGRGKSEDMNTKLVDVLNLETGEEGAIICNALIVKAFEEAQGPLIGRLFAIQEGGIKEGKKYRSIEMVELGE